MNDETCHDTDLRIQVLDDDGDELEYRRLPMGPDGTYAFELVCQRGADAVHFAVTDERDRIFRCEIPAEPEWPVHVELSRNDNDNWSVESTNNQVLVLKEEAKPLPIIPLPLTASKAQTPVEDERWEVALVIDGTMVSGSDSAFLSTDDEAWPKLRSELTALLAALDRDANSLSFTVIAFGDHGVEGVTAKELKPEYLLRVPAPGNERRMVELRAGDSLVFRPFRKDAVESLLAAIEPSPGGDFVDGLSDALAACNGLRWSRNARKLVVICGDSPGHSIEYPIGDRGDATVRVRDVDLEAAELHRTQVEILTIYHRPPPDLEPKTGHGHELLQGAAQQYRRLASIPDYALETGFFKPAEVAERLTRRDFPIGRNASYAHLLAPGSDGERGAGERVAEKIPISSSLPSSP
ncbi:MAG: hypothetical protein LGR52_00980 [Candidatus Thiosymbion ectosymbiont of Robbea hypermnestra]|nr:hypothetical protein [Candidatus Thiosymbion ectosymbiont of Robbea hypermnestra]